MKESEKCPYLDCEEQTIPHLFIECLYVKIFWNSYRKWWKDHTNEMIILDVVEILYGVLKIGKNKKLLNLSIFTAKYHIFLASVSEEKVNFKNFLLETETRCKIEKQIATQKQNTEEWRSKWIQFFS